MHRVRRVHDRLPAQRQEHPREELPRPGRGRRRGGAPADDRDRRPAARGRPMGGRHPGDGLPGHEGRGQGPREGRPIAGAVPTPDPRPVPEGAARTFTAEHVVFSAGTWGTQSLLHRLRADGQLPDLSPRLGALTRTNSESLVGVVNATPPGEGDFTHGVAITSSFFPDPNTHIEPVRYGKGSNAMLLLGTVMSDGAEGVPRYKQWFKAVMAQPHGRPGFDVGPRRVRARHHRPGHAEREQLHRRVRRADTLRPVPPAQPAGRGRAEPDAGSRSPTTRCVAWPGSSRVDPWATGARSSTPR